MIKRFVGPGMLLLAAVIWGSSFVVMKNAVDFLTPATLLFVRFVLASLFLTLLFFKQLRHYPKDKIMASLLCGVCLFFAYYIQTQGLALTTPGKNAFLSAVYVAIVPFLTWLFDRKAPSLYHFIAALMCIVGIGLVSLDSDLTINLGDLLTIISGFLYALHIICLKKFAKGVDGGAFTTLQFYSTTLCAFIAAFLFEDITLVSQITPNIFLQIGYLAIFATGICMLFQTIGEQRVNECTAALLLSLESVFGVLFSVIFYNEVLTLRVILGFMIIFIAIVISQTKLSFLKKFSKVLMVLCLVGGCFSIVDVQAEEDWGFEAEYAYVIDISTNQTLYEKNGDEKIYPASMTKVMTALVALNNIDDLGTVLTITNEDLEGLYEAGASTANLAVGEEVTYRDLLYGILLPSGADACKAMSRALFGSEEEMVNQMNQEAETLGLVNTNFVNATGLHDDNHYSTVHDIAVITQTALKNETFKEIFSTRTYNTETTQHYMASSIIKYHWRSGKDISHIVGCKTGYTSQSKSCITALVTSQDQNLVCTFAHEENSAAYVDDCQRAITYANNHYSLYPFCSAGDTVETIKIKDGITTEYPINVPEDISLFLSSASDLDNYTLEYDGVDSVEAPTNVGEKLGKINLKYNGETKASYTIKMEEEIDATDLAKFTRFVRANIVSIVIGAIIVIILLAYILRAMYRRHRRKARARQRRRRNRR